jgi:micrococcal nuclease
MAIAEKAETEKLDIHHLIMSKKIICLLFCLCSLAGCNNSRSGELQAQQNKEGLVVAIKDGDTIEMIVNGKSTKIRLFDIDCPEKKQPFGQVAKAYVAKLAFNKYATLSDNKKKDRNGRVLSTVHVGAINLNQEMVKAGLAWHFKRYSKRKDFALLEAKARQDRRGLWADPNPIAPWDYRKSRRKVKLF